MTSIRHLLVRLADALGWLSDVRREVLDTFYGTEVSDD